MQKTTKTKIWLTVILVGAVILSVVGEIYLKDFFMHLPPRHHSGNSDPNSVVNLG